MEEVARRLTQALRERDWPAAELARRLGVSPPTVHAWLHGQHGLRRANAARVGAALDVPVAWLLFGDDQDAERVAQGADELAVLRLYRAADEPARQDAMRLLARGR